MTVDMQKKQDLTTTSREDLPPFFFYRNQIDQEIANHICGFGEKTKLRDACEYALTNGGKRFRPLIVLLTAEALGHEMNVYPSALAVEFFHTASLIVDDLPCMDNDDERRDKASLHKVYGESVALLSSYALITAAFEKIHANALVMQQSVSPFAQFSDKACVIALEAATHCAGILGATGGQFLDLFPPNQTLDMVKQVMYKKTVTLFEVSFVLGWVFGGGDISKLTQVRKAAYHFGMAFQTADDLGDIVQDEKKQKDVSIARLLGKREAFLYFDDQMNQLKKTLLELNLFTPAFEKMYQTLAKRVFE